jgi:hypothetical protein
MLILTKSVLLRFIRGGISTMIASMATLAIFAGQNFEDIKGWLIALAIAGFTGFVSGVILAADKYFREVRKK